MDGFDRDRDLEVRRRWPMIEAAVAAAGRAVSNCEKVYLAKRYESPKTHRELRAPLETILPDGGARSAPPALV